MRSTAPPPRSGPTASAPLPQIAPRALHGRRLGSCASKPRSHRGQMSPERDAPASANLKRTLSAIFFVTTRGSWTLPRVGGILGERRPQTGGARRGRAQRIVDARETEKRPRRAKSSALRPSERPGSPTPWQIAASAQLSSPATRGDEAGRRRARLARWHVRVSSGVAGDRRKRRPRVAAFRGAPALARPPTPAAESRRR